MLNQTQATCPIVYYPDICDPCINDASQGNCISRLDDSYCPPNSKEEHHCPEYSDIYCQYHHKNPSGGGNDDHGGNLYREKMSLFSPEISTSLMFASYAKDKSDGDALDDASDNDTKSDGGGDINISIGCSANFDIGDHVDGDQSNDNDTSDVKGNGNGNGKGNSNGPKGDGPKSEPRDRSGKF